MSRIKFPKDKTAKGSQKWLQEMVKDRPDLLQPATLPQLEWLSPLAHDDYAEYMDAAFLARLNLSHLTPALKTFWPSSGPRWDGLARAKDAVVLVEAKAHLREAHSSPSTAKATASIQLIATSLDRVKTALGANPAANWTRRFYQYANRLAHLWWLRDQGIDAHLLLISFLNNDKRGPTSTTGWHAVYTEAHQALGLPAQHPLSRYIHHIYPDVTQP